MRCIESSAKLNDRDGDVSRAQPLHDLFHPDGHVHDGAMGHVDNSSKFRKKIRWQKKRNVTRHNLDPEDS